VQRGPKRDEPIYSSLESVVNGLGMSVVEMAVSRHRGSVQANVVVYKKDGVGVADCSRVHRAIEPRLSLAYPDQEIYIETASPGIDRTLKDAAEFDVFAGRGVRCYRTDISDWTAGIVAETSADRVTLRNASGLVEIPFSVIAKAKLDYSQEVET
jgi:ribosome maturation factor RimP